MGYKTVLIVAFIVGMVFVIIDLVKVYSPCPPNQIIYRYLPRTFKEEQENPVPATEIFASMFNDVDPWIASLSTMRDRDGNINKYFISQY